MATIRAGGREPNTMKMIAGGILLGGKLFMMFLTVFGQFGSPFGPSVLTLFQLQQNVSRVDP